MEFVVYFWPAVEEYYGSVCIYVAFLGEGPSAWRGGSSARFKAGTDYGTYSAAQLDTAAKNMMFPSVDSQQTCGEYAMNMFRGRAVLPQNEPKGRYRLSNVFCGTAAAAATNMMFESLRRNACGTKCRCGWAKLAFCDKKCLCVCPENRQFLVRSVVIQLYLRTYS